MYTKLSKYHMDTNVFGPYVMQKLEKTAQWAINRGMVAHFAAISEDSIPSVFTADTHMMRRVAERLHISYATTIIAEIINAVETNDELGQLLLDAADTTNEAHPYSMAALWVEEYDVFTYIYCYEDRFHITTVLSGNATYYVNKDADLICAIRKNGELTQGIGNIGRFKESMLTKHKGF